MYENYTKEELIAEILEITDEAAGAVTIRVEASRQVRSSRGELVGEDDVTEVGLDDVTDWDFVIDNDGDYAGLQAQVDNIIKKLG